MMTSSNGNIFRVTGPLWGESTGHRWIPLTKASDAELWCFRWSAPEQIVEQTLETPVIWDAVTLIMTSLKWNYLEQYRLQRICELSTWKRHDMETLSIVLVLLEGNPPVITGLPSQSGNEMKWILMGIHERTMVALCGELVNVLVLVLAILCDDMKLPWWHKGSLHKRNSGIHQRISFFSGNGSILSILCKGAE